MVSQRSVPNGKLRTLHHFLLNLLLFFGVFLLGSDDGLLMFVEPIVVGQETDSIVLILLKLKQQ